MARKYMGMLHFLLIFLVNTKPTHAIPWQEAPSTLPATSATSTAPSPPSEPPLLPTPPPLILNGPLEPPNVCGYVNHDFQNPYTCPPSQTCLWNAPLSLVACGSPSSVTFHTACLPYRSPSSSSCANNSTCISDISILHCPSDVPHCANARVGPDGGYAIRACQIYPSFGRLRVELEYGGQSVLGHLPRWLEGGGVVRYGTVMPESSSSLNTGVVSGVGGAGSGGGGEINPATVPGGVFTVVVSSYVPGGDKYCNSTCREERYEGQVRKQVLAGGVVGGCMGIGILGFGAWVVWVWRRRVGRRGAVEGAGGDGFVLQNVRGKDDSWSRSGSGSGRAGGEGGGIERGRTPSLEVT